MFARYMHMLSWGLLYSFFSFVVVYIYRNLNRTTGMVVVNFGKKELWKLNTADLIAYFLITTVSAIRLNTGSDFYNYYQYFNQVKEKYTSLKEILIQSQGGYYALSWIVKSITDYEFAIFVVIAVFSYAYLFYMIRKEVKDTPCALACYMFLGYYAYSNNILKQYIAMSLIMCAYLNYDRKKLLKFIIFVALATCFHYSALFVAPIMFVVRKLEPSFGKYWLAIIGGGVVGIGLSQILTILIRLIPSASGYSKYIDWRRSDHFRLIAAVFGMCVIYAVLIYIILKYRGNVKAINKKRYHEIVFLIIGLAINVIAIRQWIINRIAIYFYQFIILILPCIFENLDFNKKRKLKIAIYSLMFLYMIFSSVFLGENEYYSYNTIFSGDAVISDVQYNILHGWTK